MITEQSQNEIRGHNYFNERQYLKTNIRTGVTLNRAQTRYLSLTSDFLIGLRNGLINECGQAANEVFHSAGKKWGRKYAERFDKELSDFYQTPVNTFPLAVFSACLAESFSHHGWGKLQMDYTHHKNGLLIAVVRNPLYATLVGESDQATDSLLAGIFGGVFTYFADRELACFQTQCQACGAEDSRFVIGVSERLRDVSAWLEDGRSHDDIVLSLAEVSL